MTSCSSLWEVHQDDGMRAQRLGAAWQLSGGEEFQSRAPRRARDSGVPYRPRTATLTNANLESLALALGCGRGSTGETGDYDAKVELRQGRQSSPTERTNQIGHRLATTLFEPRPTGRQRWITVTRSLPVFRAGDGAEMSAVRIAAGRFAARFAIGTTGRAALG